MKTDSSYSHSSIGVFDSGVGGLTVLRSLQKELPLESFIYLGDMARLPYGIKSKAVVVQYALQAAEFLKKSEIKLLVIACNTASALALEVLQEQLDIPVIGVIEAGAKAAISQTQNKNIAVIATEATITSSCYEQAIKKHLPEAMIIGKSCGLFVALAEEGLVEGDIALSAARWYLEPLFKGTHIIPDVLLLGCTHFPLLKNTIASVLNPNVSIVDSAEYTAKMVADYLKQNHLLNGEKGLPIAHQYYVTDYPQRFSNSARLFLGQEIDLDKIILTDLR